MDGSQEVDAGSHVESKDNVWISDLADPEGRTDLANARRFVARYGKQARYCFAWKKWLVWDGVRWQVDTLGAVRKVAQSVADDVWTQFRLAGRDADSQRWASYTASERGMRRMLAGAEVRLAVTPGELDDYPWLLNCQNGVLDLRTGELLPHDSSWMLTKLCPVEFQAEATSELWERTVGEMMSQDPEMITLLQQLAGYFLTGDVQEQVMPILIGDGANGKSTFIDAIAGVLGDYATPLDPTVIVSKWSDEVHPTGRSVLAGRRLAIACETSENCQLNEAAVKVLTGKDAITTRQMREDHWSFLPTHKMVLVTNHLPVIKGTDYGIRRRLLPIPFRRRFSPEECDKGLPERLKSENQGILAWMVRGCREWQQKGLQVPASVQATAARYRSEQDLIGELIATLCVAEAGSRMRLRDLEAAASRRCRSLDVFSPSSYAFSRRLAQLGFQKAKSGDIYFHGLRLVTDKPTRRDEAGSDERPSPRDSTGKSVRPSVCPDSVTEAGESEEELPDWDEAGFDETPGSRDSTMKIVRSSVCPKSLVEVVEYVEEPPARDEAGFDERPKPRDSTGKTVHPSVCPELAMDARESADQPGRRRSRRTKARGEHPVFRELRELVRNAFVSESDEQGVPPDQGQ